MVVVGSGVVVVVVGSGVVEVVGSGVVVVVVGSGVVVVVGRRSTLGPRWVNRGSPQKIRLRWVPVALC